MANLFSLSEAASIALHGVILIAKENGGLNVIKIAERTDTSKHHVAKVMQRLVKAGFLTSQRGPSGGFLLKKDPASITFLDIYENIEGPIEVSDCPMDKQICPFDKCIIDNVTNKMTIEFRNFLSNQTIDKYL
ncbi:MAG: Rrf2 family transcriptional regulator [Bacteroidales bacterium]|nr:Rrf2 family transcriptional regulator [Bacteroidales bacterium]